MGRYIARRLAQGLVVIFGVTVFVFVVTRLIGDPVKFMLPLSATEEQREATARRARTRPVDPDASSSTSSATWSGSTSATSTYVRGEPALDVVMRLPAHDAATGRRSACCSRSC